MLSRSGHAKIMDFGIAALRAAPGQAKSGVLFGTPRYMSPEQIIGRPADHRSDIFALGAVLYEMLTGSYAFDGADTKELWRKIAVITPPPPSQVLQDVPEALDHIVERAMAKATTARYQSAKEMAADLRAILARLKGGDEPLKLIAEAPKPAAASVTGVAGAVTGVAAYWPLSPNFDSVTALVRCVSLNPAERSGLGPPPPPPSALQRLLGDGDIRTAVIIAVVGAAVALSVLFS
jgi:serine/threonine-protein kinase